MSNSVDRSDAVIAGRKALNFADRAEEVAETKVGREAASEACDRIRALLDAEKAVVGAE